MTPPRTSRLRILKAAAILGACIWVYGPALRGTWLWDDSLEVSENPALRTLQGLRNSWLSPHGPDYLPFKTSVQWLQWRLWGDATLGYHLTNVALHALNCLLIWWLFGNLRRLWSERRGRPAPDDGCEWLAGLLFAVHPLAVESVAWIAELKNTLSLPFLLLSLAQFVEFERGGNRRAYALSLLAFVCGMLCKTSVVMLPVILLLLIAWLRGRPRRRDWADVAPFLAVALLLGAIALWFQESRTAAAGLAPVGLIPRIALAGRSLSLYVKQGLLPFRLMPIYPQWTPSLLGASSWILAAAAFFILWRHRSGAGRHGLLALGFFVLTLLPVLGFVPMAYHRFSWAADHLAYIPLASVACLGAAAMALIRTRPARWIVATLLVLGLAIESHTYARIFQNPLSFWTYAVEENPKAASAHYDLGMALLGGGDTSGADAQLEATLQLDPSDVQALNNLGNLDLSEGRTEEALAAYRRALQLRPDLPEVHNNLGSALFRLRRNAEALDEYSKAVQLKPDYAEALTNLANALIRAGRYPEARERYLAALKLEPGSPEAHNGLGLALFHLGRADEAISHYQEALRLRPNYPEAHYNLSRALMAQNRLEEARRELEASDPGGGKP